MAKLAVIACDLDGTLLNSSKQISPKTLQALIEAQQRGVKVILASGRNVAMVMPFAQQLNLDQYGGFIVGMNGHEIYDCTTKETVITDSMTLQQTRRVFAFAKKYKTQFLCEHDQGFLVYTPAVMFPIKLLVWFLRSRHALKKRHQTEYSLIGGFVMKSDANVKVIHRSNQINTGSRKIGIAQVTGYTNFVWPRLLKIAGDDLNVMKVTPYWIDIMASTVSKAAGIKIALAKTQLTFDHLIAFGDAQNDISMIQAAKVGVCMSNGMEDVKEVADIICDSNDEDGIAKTLSTYLSFD